MNTCSASVRRSMIVTALGAVASALLAIVCARYSAPTQSIVVLDANLEPRVNTVWISVGHGVIVVQSDDLPFRAGYEMDVAWGSLGPITKANVSALHGAILRNKSPSDRLSVAVAYGWPLVCVAQNIRPSSSRWNKGEIELPPVMLEETDIGRFAPMSQHDRTTPHMVLWKSFAINTVLLALVIGLTERASTLGFRRFVSSWRRSRGLCVGCGYPEDSMPRCPECGALRPALDGRK